MPQISKKTIYTEDSTISDGDSWVGTDANDNNKTKTYTVGAIKEFLIANIGGGGIEILLDGFKVLSAGKTDLTIWEDEDKFSGWVGDVYYVGKIKDASALTMPDDILDTTKVSLVTQSPAL
ncbi:hypothetical protein [Thalassobellus suaedae]|uniref:Uncharacterized protein n=1 Tax=Thalassobellus suaedae TaxID=3074124 RepID=A0ABY9XWD8_9FLAO|nr:hypothetical protein RHP51_04995 [Flavobacteriaceae bacterium HL-DH14]